MALFAASYRLRAVSPLSRRLSGGTGLELAAGGRGVSPFAAPLRFQVLVVYDSDALFASFG